ncbi:Gfo/Idh/MocA family protein [Magnetospirillum gryphiswaldense]|uniref:Oxidoreductase, N-terminal:Oxidoreductase, C-terminal n=1 Tax=Magnetospirillum gryphiswaldense TaxID=55518 RepID=A4TUX4_9PROT|nr:Gfo/Idh/MocA family oxidoreductase [Magnetospirillum gryphiswaldense]AVM76376.1 putative oxidoreductase YvaA [Magnetospirillum gryphiswaldense MSR-1]AVM80279.1 putative oxidoreductase YvaA [Magnetospirillum gryphiswaldense]CAM74431.1 Oxidoreductase, N-terminal:Oxidoreductase, C-terminal [Magnetospirillum gryphiswaldense MSR-1]
MSIGVGVVGFGYWGPNLARNLAVADGVDLVAVCDADPRAQARVQRLYPGVRTYAALDELLADGGVDAVVVATPVRSHADFALAALRSGRHVLVEKPMAETVAQAELMVEIAAAKGLTLMVDHTFVYTGAVARIAAMVQAGELGRLLYYDSVRINLGLFQSDVDVLWDLAVHDLSILDHLTGAMPVEVSCITHSHFPDTPANMAYLTLFYGDGLIAHTHVNWLSPVKIRQTVLGGERRMVVYDDIEPDEKLKIYDRGVSFSGAADLSAARRVDYRSGDVIIPALERGEALAGVVGAFRDAVTIGRPLSTDGRAGLRVVRILEAAGRSAKERGRAVPVRGD